MTDIVTLPIEAWDQACSAAALERATSVLERGSVVLFPQLSFPLRDGEDRLLSPATAGRGKNVSLNPSGGVPRGSGASEVDLLLLQNMMSRFAASSRALLHNLFPRYDTGLRQARTSFRPAEIAGRATSWRKDDTRLHIDSFPSSPTRGARILRVFTNINPNGKSRSWKLGESFEAAARRHLPRVRGPVPGVNHMLRLIHATKGLRSDYDHYMLRLHDSMKSDTTYQREVPQSVFEFQPGCSWMVFTDEVSHAVTTGQYALEQTFELPVSSMLAESQSPLRVLERLLGRRLV